MAFEVFFHKKAFSELKKLDKPVEERIKKEVSGLASNPEKGKHLRHCNFWSLRVGDHRAIYEIKKQEQKVIILFVGHRKNVYDDLTKLI